jgi:Transposase IS66 family
LQARLAAHVVGSDKIFADDTPIPVLDPGRGRTKTGRVWVYTRDDRPWGGPDPPAAVYFYSPDRKAERPASHLEAFHGVLQVDGYAGFERLTERGNIVLAACWAHTRRKFFDVHEATGSPIAAEALRRIAELYAIEKSIRGRTAEERRSVRNTKSRPLVEAMKPWLETQLGRIPGGGSLADAIRYTLSRWPALCHFLVDGRIELDNNSVERAIRPVATSHSLCTPSSSIWEHRNLIFGIGATRATVSPDRGGDPIVLEVGGTDLVRSARHDLFGGDHTILDEAANPVVGDAELRSGFGHREPLAVLLGGAIGANAVHPPQ